MAGPHEKNAAADADALAAFMAKGAVQQCVEGAVTEEVYNYENEEERMREDYHSARYAGLSVGAAHADADYARRRRGGY